MNIDAKMLAQSQRLQKTEEDLRKWCIEQAVRCLPSDPCDLARKIESYIRGRAYLSGE